MTMNRDTLDRVIAMINDKGGVGKTTLSTNVAGQLAAANQRVLLIDANRQANCAEDLGYRGREGVDDQGSGLLMALMGRAPLQPARDIRPNLDVVPGGTELADLTPVLTSRMQVAGREAFLALAEALSPIAEDYDVIIVDSPPENVVVEDLVLATARWAIMPTRSDRAGLIGMQLTADRFVRAREVNPTLELLGVVLFGTLSAGTQIRQRVRDQVAAAFGADPMLDTAIRSSEKLAQEARERGLLAHELQAAALRGVSTDTALGVAQDYYALTEEILTLLAAAEQTDEQPSDTSDQHQHATTGEYSA